MSQMIIMSETELSICIQSIEASDWSYAGGAEIAKALADRLKKAYVVERGKTEKKRKPVAARREG